MDAGLDTGPILMHRRIDPRPGETFADIYRRMEPLGVLSMMEAVRGLRDGTLQPRPREGRGRAAVLPDDPRLAAAAQSRLDRSFAAGAGPGAPR